jgi:hypothetical protein
LPMLTRDWTHGVGMNCCDCYWCYFLVDLIRLATFAK